MSKGHCPPRGVIFENQTVTWTFGSTSLTIPLTAKHKRVPVITAVPINSINANYNIFVASVTKTSVVLGISNPAPHNLTTSIHAVSTL